MAKMYGYSGKVTGKKGDNVFSVRGGEQIIRQYNPIVANPSTKNQVKARSRMKLMSQLSAVYAAIIAMPKEGNVTARNKFVKKNYTSSSTNAQGVASIDLPTIQLTDSQREMQQFNVTRASGTTIDVVLTQAVNYDRVVYAIVAKSANEKLRVFASAVVENANPGSPDTFAAKLPYTAEAIVVYGYGINDSNAKAEGAFGDLNSPTAEQVAKLIASRSLSTSDYVLTGTLGSYLEVGTTSASSGAGSGSSGVVTPGQGGSSNDTEQGGGNNGGTSGGNGGGNGGSSNGTYTLTITKTGGGSASVMAGGNMINSGASVAEDAQVTITINPAAGTVPSATIGGNNISLTEDGGTYTGSFNMPGSNSTLAINTGSTGDGDTN